MNGKVFAFLWTVITLVAAAQKSKRRRDVTFARGTAGHFRVGDGVYDQSFDGGWKLSMTIPFPDFSSTEGKAKFGFTDDEENKVSVMLYDTPYIDATIAFLEFSFKKDPSSPLKWSATDALADLEVFRRLDPIDETTCGVNATLSFQQVGPDVYQGSLEVNSSNCSVNFTMSLVTDTKSYFLDLISYSGLASGVAVILLLTTHRLLIRLIAAPGISRQISLLAVGVSLLWDCSLYSLNSSLAVNFYGAISFGDFYFFLIPGVLFLFQFFLEFNLLLRLWDARIGAAFNTRREYLEAVVIFLVKFIVLFFAGLYLFVHFLLDNTAVILASAFFVPQIIHSAMRGAAAQDLLYIFGLFPPKLLIAIYFRGCPNNFFELTPSKSFPIAITVVLFIQLAIVLLQRKCGSRFFIPSCLLPPRHEYLSLIHI
eukprot:TRINITY_DN12118_c0_g1_i5.p1 TRINITY_DN12118_c0_g1~~TRINITY_DN12118_c0_g1_i5.p1  ORF type:complete len:426 (-),score=61.51 TRINITY_DN12118_c0_g1_i5:61-1338(-)